MGCVLCNLFFSLLEVYHTFPAQIIKMVDKLEINQTIELNVTQQAIVKLNFISYLSLLNSNKLIKQKKRQVFWKI